MKKKHSKRDDKQRFTDIAVFRYGVISSLVHPDPGDSRSQSERIRELALREHRIPHTGRTGISEQTIRSWLGAFRRGGFDALKPKARRDRGQPRKMSAEMLEALIETKRGCPSLSIADSIAAVRLELGLADEVPMPVSTVHRLFTGEGLMEQAAGAPKDRRRFEFAEANQMWTGDVMHGPAVFDGARKRKTYLIDFIDDCTRVIPYAQFMFSETVSALMQVFKQALKRRGVPQRLFVDNGSAYRSKSLSVACARLNIALLHAQPYDGAAKGKIERWHRTCRSQFIAKLGEADLASIDALNEKLRAWIEGEYHRAPHRGIGGLAPLQKWSMHAAEVRMVEERTDLDDLFLFEQQRRVTNARTVSLHNTVYEVEAHLIGKSVTLRYDPDAPADRPIQAVHDGETTAATPLDAQANARVKRRRPPSRLRFDRYPQQGDR